MSIKHNVLGENTSKTQKPDIAPDKVDVALFAMVMLLLAVSFPQVSAKRADDSGLQVALPPMVEPLYIARSAEEELWTLEFQIHAPRYGYTSGTTTWSYESTYVVGPYGSSSTVSFGLSLTTTDGRTIGRFERCIWKYQMWESIIGTSREYWFITQRKEIYTNNYIYGTSTTTDADDIESFTYDGYRSHSYRTRYLTQDRREDNNLDQWIPLTVSATSGNYIQLGLTITVAVKNYAASGTFSLKNARSTTWQYTYWLAPHHSWSIDYLDNKNIIWAFNFNW